LEGAACDSIKRRAAALVDRVADRVAERVVQRLNDGRLSDSITYRILTENLLAGGARPPHDLFASISDDWWFWICTEGYRRIPSISAILPGMPPDDVHLNFTGNKGD
jgi:hypothetical protein